MLPLPLDRPDDTHGVEVRVGSFTPPAVSAALRAGRVRSWSRLRLTGSSSSSRPVSASSRFATTAMVLGRRSAIPAMQSSAGSRTSA